MSRTVSFPCPLCGRIGEASVDEGDPSVGWPGGAEDFRMECGCESSPLVNYGLYEEAVQSAALEAWGDL